jgi:catechol 2,3-dioxygenase-like lactoylglutathione lyase family enzyme
MALGVTKVLHVKLPVTDLQRSVTWYGRLMDLALAHEFVEEDELRGAALRSAEGDFSIALRLRRYCAGSPDLTGHDVAAFHVESRDALHDVQRRAADLGAVHTDVQERGPGQAVVDVTDPDGTVLRFFWVDPAAAPETFVGYVFDGDGPPMLVGEPRLDAPEVLGR